MLIDNRIWLRHSITHWRGNSVESIVVRWSERIGLLKYDWWIADYWDADSLEYYITKNSKVTPSEHFLSLHPSVFWISKVSEMEQISRSVESIVIKRNIGEGSKSFKLSNLPSLISIQLNGNKLCCSGSGNCHAAFGDCHSIVFESMNDWMNHKSDLTKLQSIILGSQTLCGFDTFYDETVEPKLTMRSMNDNDDWLIRSSFSDPNQRRWWQFL